MPTAKNIKLLLVSAFANLLIITSANCQVQVFNFPQFSFIGSVNVGNGAPKVTDPSAYLEIGPANGVKGMLPARGNKDAVVNPATGLIIYDLPTSKYWYYNGTTWLPIGQTTIATPSDTLLYTTNDHLKRLTDSLIFIISNKANTDHAHTWASITSKPTTKAGFGITDVVAYADTAAMLDPYLRKIDTAAMLLNYMRKGDTLTFDQPLEKYLTGGKWHVRARNESPFWNAGYFMGIPIKANLVLQDGYNVTYNANGPYLELTPPNGNDPATSGYVDIKLSDETKARLTIEKDVDGSLRIILTQL